jgi:hypothetical protein
MTEPSKAVEKKREKRTITEIRDSKKTGEKMVFPDYTAAQGPRWRASTSRSSATVWR